MKKKLFIITGEYSGDKHAADVVREIWNLNPDIEIEAVGGENLEKEGVKIYCGHSKMAAMGFNLKIIMTHLQLGEQIALHLKDEFKPDMVLMIDYGGFNLNLSKVISKYGIKIYYYIPPQVWASRKWRLGTIKQNIQKVLTIFPFEKAMYEEMGIDAEFVGHPLLAELPKKADRNKVMEENGLDKTRRLVSIFPGSRKFEIKNLLPLFLQSAQIIKKYNPDIQFALAQAPNIKDSWINPVQEKYSDLNIKVLKNKNYDLLAASDALILASGTVALEAALYQTPMIISYKGPWFLYFVYLTVRSIKRVCLPNIIMDKDIVPELLQLKAKPKLIADNINKILNDAVFRNKMIKDLEDVKQKLQTSAAAQKAASIIVNDI